ADTDPEGRAWFAAFRQGLQELGWVEGRNFRADYRWPSGDLDRMRAIAKEFVDLKPDVMFAGNTPSVEALLRESSAIPTRIRESFRSGRNWRGWEPGASRRQRYWVHRPRVFACWQMAGNTQRGRSRCDAGRAPV